MFFVSQICFVFSHLKRTFFIFREERRGNNYPGLICQRFWFRGKHFYSLLTLYLAQRNEDFSKTYTSKKANLRQFNSCYHLMYSHIATLKNRQTISKWTTLNYLWAIFVCAEFRKKLDEKVRLFIEEKASFPLTDTKKKQNLQLNMRNLTWQNNGNFDGKCLCLFTCGIPEKSHGTKEVFVFPYFFINFIRRIFLQERRWSTGDNQNKGSNKWVFSVFLPKLLSRKRFCLNFPLRSKVFLWGFYGWLQFPLRYQKTLFYVLLRYHNKSKWP